MNDVILVTKFLMREFPDEHPLIFIYVCGQKRSEQTSIEKMMSLTKQIFSPPLHEEFVLDIVKKFLLEKKNLYKKGLITVKSYYAN